MSIEKAKVQFSICVTSETDSDLETWKVYRVLPDIKAQAVGCLRVIDESSEDYLYPEDQFAIVELPTDIQERLLAAVGE